MSAETHLEVYRPFTGELRQSRLRFWPILATGLRTAMKQRRALLILYTPAVIATVIMCFTIYVRSQTLDQMQPGAMGRGADPQAMLLQKMIEAQAREMVSTVTLILRFSQALGLWTFLALAWFASGLFCEDRKVGAHQLYFSRPITRFDYLLGKFLIACTFAAAAVLLPPLIVCVVATFSVPEWAFLKNEWDVFPRSLAFGTVWTVTLSSLVLVASALASRKSFALLGCFAGLFLASAMSQILGQLVHDGFFALTLFDDLNAVAHSIFDRPGGAMVSQRNAWFAVIGFNLLCWWVMWWRLRRLEVVA